MSHTTCRVKKIRAYLVNSGGPLKGLSNNDISFFFYKDHFGYKGEVFIDVESFSKIATVPEVLVPLGYPVGSIWFLGGFG